MPGYIDTLQVVEGVGRRCTLSLLIRQKIQKLKKLGGLLYAKHTPGGGLY
jgi:hypothetical protein